MRQTMRGAACRRARRALFCVALRRRIQCEGDLKFTVSPLTFIKATMTLHWTSIKVIRFNTLLLLGPGLKLARSRVPPRTGTWARLSLLIGFCFQFFFVIFCVDPCVTGCPSLLFSASQISRVVSYRNGSLSTTTETTCHTCSRASQCVYATISRQ